MFFFAVVVVVVDFLITGSLPISPNHNLITEMRENFPLLLIDKIVNLGKWVNWPNANFLDIKEHENAVIH
jgi:hypothetical protein